MARPRTASGARLAHSQALSVTRRGQVWRGIRRELHGGLDYSSFMPGPLTLDLGFELEVSRTVHCSAEKDRRPASDHERRMLNGLLSKLQIEAGQRRALFL